MLKNLLNLNGVEKLNKENQRAIHGGMLLSQCVYVCHGTTARQPAGASQYCLLNFPIHIYNASQCTDGGDDGIVDWA
ncbi:hypothetical protein [Aquimarina litoralis]|uniref:hypothetical protein n=1 Tax=Aquimarina litoralis TaxID=584605 RepID=UPI001C57DE44|nr:hypothetical protein [Aquimarina litoralis]MBW1298849.1 hypothetical protein [Aquimarina litoralis]